MKEPYYCHVAPLGCPRDISTWNFHGLPQICWLKVWHKKYGHFSFCVFLFHQLAACLPVFIDL